MTIENGGEVESSSSEVGKENSAIGWITVVGDGSSWKTGRKYEVGRYGNGTLTVSDGGSFAVGAVYSGIANNTLQVAVNGGSTAGDTAQRAGTIVAERILFGDGNGSLIFNHTDTDYSFNPEISENGTITHLSGTTFLSADSLTFSGTTTVSGGNLILDDALLGGTIDVFDNGVFGGNGTAGRAGATMTISNGGNLSPGFVGAIGILNVSGDLVFDAGSIYAVDVSTSSSDLTPVSGEVTINGGTLAVTLLDPQTSYQDFQTYEILSATGGITGDFTMLAHNSAFLDVSYQIVGDDLILSLGLDDSFGGFSGAAQTLNEKAVAASLDALQQSRQSLELFNALLPMNAEDARSAFRQLSGEIHATTSSMLIGGAQSLNTMLSDRMMGSNATFSGGNPFHPLGYAEEAAPAAATDAFAGYGGQAGHIPHLYRSSVWASIFSAWSDIDGSEGTLSSRVSTGGLMIGADGMVTDSWNLGLYGGYSGSSARTDLEKAGSDNYHVGIYGGGEWGAFSFRVGAG
jgi:T5SS/PEP-CTERM-associated repeat protein